MVLLAGCGSSEVKPLAPTSIAYPTWYTQPQSANVSQLVGAGEGETRDEAIQAALVDLLSQLSIEVAASFDTRLSVHKQDFESVERVSEKRIQASVANTEIRNYQLKHIKRLAYDKTVALVTASRAQLFSDIKTQFDQDLALLKSQQKQQVIERLLATYVFYGQHQAQVDDLAQRLKVLQALDAHFDGVSASRYLQGFIEKAMQLKHQLVIEVQADAGSEKFVPLVENALSQAGFKVQKSPLPTGYNGAGQNSILYLNTDVAVSEAYGFKIIRVNLRNRVMSDDQQLGGETWTFKGQALVKEENAMDLAMQRVAQKAKSQIEEHGINHFLGVNLVW
ncbi:LPP20 family lipoprotein [Hydrogenovibrio sp. SC-1]|uniref:LPP20 family lipoprotein n=1 Tax=Hydrogenovibrio sp. SC-1 TaxID=2065820 RepID=UPI0013042F9F|nr:LPP20 family lipoprotein [Hydrogenovibrio sp. SC-1]